MYYIYSKRRGYREAGESRARYQRTSDPSRLIPPGPAAIPPAAPPVPTATAAAAGRTEPRWGGPCSRVPASCHRPASSGLGAGGLPSAKMVHHSGSIQSFRQQKGRWQPSGSGAPLWRGGWRRGSGTAGWCMSSARRICFPTRTKVQLWGEVA